MPVMLVLGVVCSLPVIALLNRTAASSMAYGLAGFGVAFYVLTLLLAPALMHGTDAIGQFAGFGLMAESVCLLGAAVLAVVDRRAVR